MSKQSVINEFPNTLKDGTYKLIDSSIKTNPKTYGASDANRYYGTLEELDESFKPNIPIGVKPDKLHIVYKEKLQ